MNELLPRIGSTETNTEWSIEWSREEEEEAGEAQVWLESTKMFFRMHKVSGGRRE